MISGTGKVIGADACQAANVLVSSREDDQPGIGLNGVRTAALEKLEIAVEEICSRKVFNGDNTIIAVGDGEIRINRDAAARAVQLEGRVAAVVVADVDERGIRDRVRPVYADDAVV